MTGTTVAKVILRCGMLVRRRQLADTSGSAAARAVARAAFQVLRSVRCSRTRGRGRVIAGYWPIAGEIDVRPLLWRLLILGCRLALPVVAARGQPLVFRAWRPNLVLEAGLHGTYHPPASGSGQVVPDVILVPLLAFDQAGFRLGFGEGYYDRTLTYLRQLRKGKVVAIGIAFANQKVLRIPRQPRDAALDLVLCERGGITRPRGAL